MGDLRVRKFMLWSLLNVGLIQAGSIGINWVKPEEKTIHTHDSDSATATQANTDAASANTDAASANTDAASAPVIKLVGGTTSNEGNVMVDGKPVCDDYWDTKDAKVVCRMLGYTGGDAIIESAYGPTA